MLLYVWYEVRRTNRIVRGGEFSVFAEVFDVAFVMEHDLEDRANGKMNTQKMYLVQKLPIKIPLGLPIASIELKSIRIRMAALNANTRMLDGFMNSK